MSVQSTPIVYTLQKEAKWLEVDFGVAEAVGVDISYATSSI